MTFCIMPPMSGTTMEIRGLFSSFLCYPWYWWAFTWLLLFLIYAIMCFHMTQYLLLIIKLYCIIMHHYIFAMSCTLLPNKTYLLTYTPSDILAENGSNRSTFSSYMRTELTTELQKFGHI